MKRNSPLEIQRPSTTFDDSSPPPGPIRTAGKPNRDSAAKSVPPSPSRRADPVRRTWQNLTLSGPFPLNSLLGLSFPNEQSEAFTAAGDFKPLANQQFSDIRQRASEAIADKGPCWWNPAGK
jgi:hypothetical protein